MRRLFPSIWLETTGLSHRCWTIMSDMQVPGEERQQPGNMDRARIDADIDKGKDAERIALVAHTLRAGNRVGSRVRLRVFGESMLPALWPGQIVEIAVCSLDEVRPGEIVLALRAGRFFLHRLVESQANGFVLRGDSMPAADPPYPSEALLGRLVSAASTDADSYKKPGLAASACNRALGMMFCHCSIVRRLALKFNRRRTASAPKFRTVESL